MMKLAIASLLAGSSAAFAPAQQGSAVSSTSMNAMPERMWNTMVDKTERSKSMPFLPRPINLDGSYVGDVGFDPFFLSSIPKNFAGFLQPPSWEKTQGLPTLYWMRESELKHGRIAMLAWAGWLATDGAFGVPLRFPGAPAVYQDVPSSFAAHDIMVANGSLGFMLVAVGLIELCTGAVLVEVSKGESDREAGDFKLGAKLLEGKSKADVDTMKLKELTNGRAAMLAFAGVVTQAGLGGTEFPYLVPYPNVADVTW